MILIMDIMADLDTEEVVGKIFGRGTNNLIPHFLLSEIA
jgi:hypothetical protein